MSVNVVERQKEETSDNEVLCGPDDEDDENDFEHEVCTCVVRKLMLSQKHGDDTQCHKLFGTRCIVKGMRLELIIDRGSRENIIGCNVVQKFQLTPEKHLHPYTIRWIKEVNGIQVKERCKVPFSIGKYSDEVYCDIIDMDACNLLFGRPWQFDVDATHSRRKNTYKLVKEDVCYTLLPMETN